MLQPASPSDILPDGARSSASWAARPPPEGLWLMGERMDGQTHPSLKRALGKTALRLAIGLMDRKGDVAQRG
jgi:hypothetical protein